MAFRFWYRNYLVADLNLSLTKSTMLHSLGPRGAKNTISIQGNRTSMALIYAIYETKPTPLRCSPQFQ